LRDQDREARENISESHDDAVLRLKGVGLGAAKRQIEERGYADKARGEFKVVKRMAIAIVDSTKVGVEIY
jgi:hypothetical protein